jgi:GH15 family glucan-1,4-alpha-glucosidase
MGALPNEGAFIGLAWQEGRGDWKFKWLRDLPSSQRYADDDGDEIITSFKVPGAGLTVSQRDLVSADEDFLARSVQVKKSVGSSVDRVRIVSFANFNPVFSKDRNAPTQDWCTEEENDDGGNYVAKSDAAIWVRSGTDASTGAPSSVALALGFDTTSDGHQIGVDTFQTGGAGSSAYVDAKDGKLSGDDTAAGQSDAALVDELAFRSKTSVSSVSYLAAGFTQEEALRALGRARQTSLAAVRSEKGRWWRNWLNDTVIPRNAPKPVTTLAKRALITARQNSALDLIVSSLATQEPEGLDWIREGAYINRMLDVSGHPEMVTAHNERYAELQATSATKPVGGETTPSGNWAQNYYADGVVGGPISYEIDETGLGIWTLWDHYTFTHDRGYLLDVYEEIQLAAHYLSDNPPLGCRDPSTGLQCLASEGDNPNPTQTLVGAQAAWLGLDAAASAAKVIGTDTALANAKKWSTRRDELAAAIKTNFFDADCKCYTTNYEVGGTNLWPVGFEPYGSSRSSSQADANWKHVSRVLKGKETQGGYESKAILGNAYEWAGRAAQHKHLEDALMWVAKKATTDTGLLGEAWMRGPKDRSPIATMRAQPHAWSQAIFYLAALKTYGSEPWKP